MFPAVAPQKWQAMCHVARADDQHSLLSQGPQLLPDPKEPVWIMGRHAELQYRHIRVRIHHLKRHPGSMIKTAARMLMHRLEVRHQRGDVRGERRCIRRLIGHVEVPPTKPAEVIDQPGSKRW